MTVQPGKWCWMREMVMKRQWAKNWLGGEEWRVRKRLDEAWAGVA